MKVLILDPNPVWRDRLCEALQEFLPGVTLSAPHKPAELMLKSLLRNPKPDLIIMSWKDFGREALRLVLHHCPGAAVCVVTGYPPASIKQETAGASLVLHKSGFEKDALGRFVNKLFFALEVQRGQIPRPIHRS